MKFLLTTPKNFRIEENKGPLRQALRAALQLVKQRTQAAIKATSPPSAAGGFPASRTGKLASSLMVTVKGLSGSITDKVPYALALESGARRYSRGHKRKHGKADTTLAFRMQPRPFLSVIMESSQPEFQKRFAKAMDEGIKFKAT